MLRRASVVAGAAVVIALVGAVPAFANGWGNVNCGQSPTPDCQLGAGSGGSGGNQGGGHGGGDHQPSHGGSGNNGSGTGGNSGGDTIIGGTSNLAACSYVKSDYQPPAGGVVTAAYTRPTNSGATVQLAAFTRSPAHVEVRALPAADPAPGQKGAWYVWQCSTAGVTDGLYRPPVWIPDGQQPGAAQLPSPAELAQMAYKQLRLPTPSIAANPAGEQLVNLPTWMWLSSGWGPVSATATVPGVSVTATATPTSVVWSMGDGSTVTCTVQPWNRADSVLSGLWSHLSDVLGKPSGTSVSGVGDGALDRHVGGCGPGRGVPGPDHDRQRGLPGRRIPSPQQRRLTSPDSSTSIQQHTSTTSLRSLITTGDAAY
jgi:hypothetical protein